MLMMVNLQGEYANQNIQNKPLYFIKPHIYSVASRTRSQTKQSRVATPRRSNISSIFAPKFTSTPKAEAMRFRTPRKSHFHMVESSAATQTTPLLQPSVLTAINKMENSNKATRFERVAEVATEKADKGDSCIRSEVHSDTFNVAGSKHAGVVAEEVRLESNGTVLREGSNDKKSDDVHAIVNVAADKNGMAASEAIVVRNESTIDEADDGNEIEEESDGNNRPETDEVVTIEDDSSKAESMNIINLADEMMRLAKEKAFKKFGSTENVFVHTINKSGCAEYDGAIATDEVVRYESNENFAEEIFNDTTSHHHGAKSDEVIVLSSTNESEFLADADDGIMVVNPPVASKIVSDAIGESSNNVNANNSVLTPGKRRISNENGESSNNSVRPKRRVSFHRSAKEQDGSKITPEVVGKSSTKKLRRLRTSSSTPDNEEMGMRTLTWN